MIKNKLAVQGIPAIMWGEPSDKLFVVVHGNMSHKEDEVMVIFAEEATAKGYAVLSFDLPEHGERQRGGYICKVQNCVSDLTVIWRYAQTISQHISLFACSMGAYFSLLAYRDLPLEQCLFLSPVLNMELIIQNMMAWFGVSEDRLQAEKEIKTPIGQALYWDYYCYVKSHPIIHWDKPTAILYGSADDLTPWEVVSDFTGHYPCQLQVLEQGEHYFHTGEQLHCFRQWLKDTVAS